jgi:hypothetical protein
VEVSKKTLLRLIAQLIFGWDTIIGLGTYMFLSMLFQEPMNLFMLAWALFCAYLPDLDLTYFVFQSKEIRKWGHWRYGFHHPLIFLPVVTMGTWYISSYCFPAEATFLTVMTFVCVLGHFVHDSTNVGLHWFSPITREGRISFDPHRWLNIRINTQGVHLLSQEEVERRYTETARKSMGVESEIETRVETVTRVQVIWFTGCVIGIIALVFQ